MPVLVLVVLGLMEFSTFMNARNAVQFAARDGSMLAAEGGNTVGTDCVVLSKVEADIVAPATSIRIDAVSVYWSDENGAQIGANVNEYARSGSTTCIYGGGVTLTVPYTLMTAGYVEGARCDVLAGCGGGHPGPDLIGVKIEYTHRWVTSVVQQAAGGLTFRLSSGTRIEPQQ